MAYDIEFSLDDGKYTFHKAQGQPVTVDRYSDKNWDSDDRNWVLALVYEVDRLREENQQLRETIGLKNKSIVSKDHTIEQMTAALDRQMNRPTQVAEDMIICEVPE